MKVLQVLDFDLYYSDPRFKNKKPNIKGSWQEQVGDNVYYKDSKDKWVKHPSKYHNEKDIQEKDLRYHQVYISEHFYYFGESSVPVDNAENLVPQTHGVKCNHEEKLKNDFIAWIQSSNQTGIIGLPRDRIIEIKDCEVNQHHPTCRQPSNAGEFRRQAFTKLTNIKGKQK
jgi:hypothetical protein